MDNQEEIRSQIERFEKLLVGMKEQSNLTEMTISRKLLLWSLPFMIVFGLIFLFFENQWVTYLLIPAIPLALYSFHNIFIHDYILMKRFNKAQNSINLLKESLKTAEKKD